MRGIRKGRLSNKVNRPIIFLNIVNQLNIVQPAMHPGAIGMTASERRTRRKNQLRKKILETARDLFAAHGYDGVTLRGIAGAIEYAPGTIYSHFKHKDALIQALCLADLEAFETNFPRGTLPASPLEAIREIGTAYIRFALTHPNHYRLMFMTPRPVDPPAGVLETQGDPARSGYALLRQTVGRAIDAGLFRDEFRDPDLIVQTLWAGVHGMASLEITKGGDPWHSWAPADARAEAMIDAMFHGLARETG
jgi:AcrR family transcriptional regulator